MTKRSVSVLIASLALALPAPASAATWPTWGNLELNDCTFAAAANWELGALGHRADEASIEAEFEAFSKNETVEITASSFAYYWRQNGIGGVRATMRQVPGMDLWDVTHPRRARHQLGVLLKRERYLLATLTWRFGHTVVIGGVSPKGVTIITWGEERVVPWSEWWEDVMGVYVVLPV
jgi:hypothetical protein